jgi:hypothetical protein
MKRATQASLENHRGLLVCYPCDMTPRRIYLEVKDPNTSWQRLAEIAKLKGLVLRRRLAQNPSSPSKSLEEILYPRDLIVWRALAQNLSSTPKILTAVSREFPDEVLENPTLPLCHLEDPSFFHCGDILYYLLKAKSAPAEMLEAAANNLDNSRHRYAVAQNPAAPPHCLSKLALDLSPRVRRAAQENPSTPKETLTLLERVKSEVLSEEELHRAYQDKHLRLLLTQNPNTPDRLIWDIFQREPLLYKLTILRRATLPQELWELALEKVQLPVAEALAKHPQTPALALQKIYMRATRNALEMRPLFEGLSLNQNLPSALIQEALQGGFFNQSLLSNPELTEEHLVKLLTSRVMSNFRRQGLQKAAAQHPRAPQWLLELYQRAGFDPVRWKCIQPAPKISLEDEERLLSLGDFTSAIVFQNPYTREELLHSLLKKSGIAVHYLQTILMKHPRLRTEWLEEASERGDRELVFRCPKAPPALLFRLWGEISPFNTYAGSIKPTKPEEVFECLSKAYYTEGRCLAARNVHLPGALRDKFVYDRFSEVRAAVAERLELAPWQLKKLLQDYSSKVRVTASYNLGAPRKTSAPLRRPTSAFALKS